MDKQKVNTTSSMNRKGYSSSSHYRINPTAEKSEQVLAIKFVQWNVPPLESLCNSKVYLLRAKLNRGERMSREKKDWLRPLQNLHPLNFHPYTFRRMNIFDQKIAVGGYFLSR